MGKTKEIFYGPQGDRMELVVDRGKTSISNIDLFDAGLPILKHPESPKLLIENLRMSLISDGIIKLQVGRERAIEITRSQLGFRSEKNQGDWEQWRLLEVFFEAYGALELKGNRKSREKTRNKIVQINNKLINGINGSLGARIHRKDKLYEYDREQGIYRFKFLVVPLNAGRIEKLKIGELLKEIDLKTKMLLTQKNIKHDYDSLQHLCSIAMKRRISVNNPILGKAMDVLKSTKQLRSCTSA